MPETDCVMVRHLDQMLLCTGSSYCRADFSRKLEFSL
jgi:hypothetical protein